MSIDKPHIIQTNINRLVMYYIDISINLTPKIQDARVFSLATFNAQENMRHLLLCLNDNSMKYIYEVVALSEAQTNMIAKDQYEVRRCERAAAKKQLKASKIDKLDDLI